MMQAVLSILTTFVISVTSNPVPQVSPQQQCSLCQQGPNNSPISPAAYNTALDKNNPYNQRNTIPNQTPTHSSYDGTANQLLLSKILGNPGILKILDPNTKLYNQNGQEIQRNLNTDVKPSVINNYFIVPPEFFCLNNTKKADKPKNTGKKRRVNARKSSQRENNLNNDDIDESIIFTDKESNRGHKEAELANKMETKIKEQLTGSNDENNPISEAKTTKTRRKQGLKNKTNESVQVPLPSSTQSDNEELDKMDNTSMAHNSPKKRRRRPKKLKTSSMVSKEELLEVLSDSKNIEVLQDDLSNESELLKNASSTEKSLSSETKLITSSEYMPHLQNIESPVDNCETTNHCTDKRKTRNSKNGNLRKSQPLTQKITPIIPDDYFRSFLPYFYFNNYLNPNGNYPFNLEQFYNTNNGKSNRKSKKRKSKTNRKNQTKRKSQSNVIEVKLKPKNEVATTTEKAVSSERTTALHSQSIEITTQSPELPTKTHNNMEIPYTSIPQIPEDSLTEKPSIQKPKTVKTKANLEMPPTMLDELNEFMMPELGREDIVPAIRTNGIIHDYYPIFHDDPYYDHEESYYLKDLEDDRHFYTTDRGHEELLNRDRKKYDKNNEDRTPNLIVKNNINFEHGFINKERGKLRDLDENQRNSMILPSTHEKIIEEAYMPDKTRNAEVQFVTPPLLEHPDFITTKIDTDNLKNKQIVKKQDPIYTKDWADNEEFHFDQSESQPEIKSQQFGSLLNFDSEMKKEKLYTTIRPINDHIETVFAKTRVVKYGVAKDESEENISVSVPTYEDDGEMKHYSDGQTTYVMAKSLGQMDDYFW